MNILTIYSNNHRNIHWTPCTQQKNCWLVRRVFSQCCHFRSCDYWIYNLCCSCGFCKGCFCSSFNCCYVYFSCRSCFCSSCYCCSGRFCCGGFFCSIQIVIILKNMILLHKENQFSNQISIFCIYWYNW